MTESEEVKCNEAVENEQEDDNFGGDDGEEFVLVQQLLAESQGAVSTGWAYRYSYGCSSCRGAWSMSTCTCTRTTPAAAPSC